MDVLIHNAASGFNRPVMEQRPKGWDWSMNINARSLLFMSQRAAADEARGGGAIVGSFKSGSSHVLPDYVSVGASKAALKSLTRYLAIELASRKIVVNDHRGLYKRKPCSILTPSERMKICWKKPGPLRQRDGL